MVKLWQQAKLLKKEKLDILLKSTLKIKDLTAELSLNLFIDPTTVTKKGKQKFEVSLGQNKISQEFDIQYLDGVKILWVSLLTDEFIL